MSMISKEEAEKLQLPSFRIGLFNAIIDDYIKLDQCNFGKLIKNPKIIKKKITTATGKEQRTSASDTIVILGKLNFEVENKRLLERIKSYNDDVVLKISFGAGTDNSLEIERDIYIDVINRLYLGNYTPNVILTLGAFECSREKVEDNMRKVYEEAVKGGHFLSKTIPRTDFGDYLIDFQEEYNEFLKGGVAPYYKDDKLNVLVLERGKGESLKDWSKTKRSLDSWQSVLFQILYTLIVFDIFGLKHNDLHVGNVFIQENVTPQNYIYITSENTYFEVPIKYLVKIYDFDFGSFTGVGSAQAKDLDLDNLKLINRKLDLGGLSSQFCFNYGICNKPNPKFDTFTILDTLYNYTVPTLVDEKRDQEAGYLKAFIETCIDKSLLRKNWTRLCNLKVDDKGKESCRGPYIPPDNQMIKTIDIIYKNFSNYRRDMKNYPSKYKPDKYAYVYYLLPTINRKRLFG